MTTTIPQTAEQWADAIEAEMHHGYDGDIYSLAYSAGSIAGIELDIEADDDYGRQFTATNGWVVGYDARSGHWYA